MTKQVLTAGIILLSTIAATATAGEFWTSADYGHGHRHDYGYGYDYGYRPYASTVAGSYLQGKAAVIDAAGRYNLNTSKAAINAEEARRLSMENYEQHVDTYFTVRDKNRQYRAAERGPKVTQAAAVRYSKAMLPKRATAQQVDPVFGSINWPSIFENEKFSKARLSVDQQFRDRSYAGKAMNSQQSRTVAQATAAMQSELKSFLGQISPAEYLQAKNLLRTLSYEAGFAPRAETVAQR